MENLFSYGTLQSEKIQLDLFGRMLQGQPDRLSGYKKELIKIKVNPGIEEHVTIIYTGDGSDGIEGTIFSLTKDELRKADEYETKAYKRIKALLRSGLSAWVYVKNDNR